MCQDAAASCCIHYPSRSCYLSLLSFLSTTNHQNFRKAVLIYAGHATDMPHAAWFHLSQLFLHIRFHLFTQPPTTGDNQLILFSNKMIRFIPEEFCNERALDVMEEYGDASGFVRLFVVNATKDRETTWGTHRLNRFVQAKL